MHHLFCCNITIIVVRHMYVILKSNLNTNIQNSKTCSRTCVEAALAHRGMGTCCVGSDICKKCREGLPPPDPVGLGSSPSPARGAHAASPTRGRSPNSKPAAYRGLRKCYWPACLLVPELLSLAILHARLSMGPRSRTGCSDKSKARGSL